MPLSLQSGSPEKHRMTRAQGCVQMNAPVRCPEFADIYRWARWLIALAVTPVHFLRVVWNNCLTNAPWTGDPLWMQTFLLSRTTTCISGSGTEKRLNYGTTMIEMVHAQPIMPRVITVVCPVSLTPEESSLSAPSCGRCQNCTTRSAKE